MAWYSAGTVEASNDGTIVAGTGTKFLGNVRVGDGIAIAGSAVLHEVTGVTSDTRITIHPAYSGPTGSGKGFAVVPVLGYDKDLSDAFNQLRLQFGTTLAGIKKWATSASADTALSDLGFGPTGKKLSRTSTAEDAMAVLGLGETGKSLALSSTSDEAMGGLGFSPTGKKLVAAENTDAALDGLGFKAAGKALASADSPANGRQVLGLGDAAVRDAVGTVAKSGGAIIEQGSNANGEYVRFADGTQICYQRVTNNHITTAIDTLFRSAPVDFNFPAEFIGVPVLVTTAEHQNVWGVGRVLTSSTGQIVAYYTRSISSNYLSAVLTIGRWV